MTRVYETYIIYYINDVPTYVKWRRDCEAFRMPHMHMLYMLLMDTHLHMQ